jgi:SNF2 family DNA or RNA helicase
VKKLSTAVLNLASLGWHIEAEGAVMRRPGKINISISSGVDWFDLTAECDFDGVKASLPTLLAAVEKGQKFVELGDGSRGMLPEEWLAKYAPLAEMGEANGDALRFLPTQAIILDALLAAQPDATHDKKFAEVRDRLKNFGGVKASHEPESFQGSLREYQRDGLGWLQFLEEFGFGGCLADDMGLGKTVQVLAMLDRRRVEMTERAAMNGNSNVKKTNGSKKTAGPITGPLRTLVVAPKSLIFNWLDEAKRFAPQLKTFDYTGNMRKDSPEALAAADLIVTTYGTLRQDILTLREMEFHQVILDEAQAIKNPASQSAKACRLVQARHRLAMTGTPVENRLGDLWSIFEFLNPGMLGRSSNIRLFSGRTLPDKESLELLSRALRPFLLRRTKEQVLKELPAKTEQTLYCEMDDRQRKLYNELRDHYRALLTQKIKDTGLARSKIQVLEALLRLRQAACHPGLLDKKNADMPSAKFDALLAQLEEVVSEKHKVLVFSQFTSLLALVKKELDKANITYEYLDGKTSNRKEKVDRFQKDPDCPVFLISLKAGGHGLNLTAADYVYILDPWWNPAVEAQAVDRAHRLGQDKPVFVYRLIATGTVEEKILELQGQKRDLADAIISADESLLRNLSADDLQLLLS